MPGSSLGSTFRITTWGESHGKAIGVVIDGCPAGLPLNENDIQIYLDRRKPGQSKYTTKRQESDTVQILSGIFEGRTTGTPISLMIPNTDQRSRDYSAIADVYRPGHADYAYDQKYGFRDYRGGGRSSGRETIGRVAAGAVACKILSSLGITVNAYTKSIGNAQIDYSRFDLANCSQNPFYMPDSDAAAQAEVLASRAIENQDSLGGVIECVISHVPAGIGDPCFEKLDANLAKAVMSVGAVKAVEIGDGVKAASATGSTNNDAMYYENGAMKKASNHGGGIYGGISDGSDIILRAHVKPTPSISSPQQTVNRQGENTEIRIHGRHDPVIVPRAVVVVECMSALTVLDALLSSMTSSMDRIIQFFK